MRYCVLRHRNARAQYPQLPSRTKANTSGAHLARVKKNSRTTLRLRHSLAQIAHAVASFFRHKNILRSAPDSHTPLPTQAPTHCYQIERTPAFPYSSQACVKHVFFCLVLTAKSRNWAPVIDRFAASDWYPYAASSAWSSLACLPLTHTPRTSSLPCGGFPVGRPPTR